MKKFLYVAMVSVLVSVLAPGGVGWSQHEGHQHESSEAPAAKAGAEHGAGGKAVTVKGELVDMSCYMAHEGKGSKHAKCAKACILGGAPLGILTTDGKVYLLVEDHSSAKTKKPYAKARELVAETVTLKGVAYERGGTQAIVVESVTKE